MKKLKTWTLKHLGHTSTWFWLLSVALFIKWFFTGNGLVLILAAIVGCASVILAHIELLLKKKE